MIAQSLPTTPPSPQEIFDHVVAHLREQKVLSKEEDSPRCRYRLGNLACAVGCLIPDSVYDPSIEYNEIGTLFEIGDLKEFFTAYGITNLDNEKLKLLGELQAVHDNIAPPFWNANFKALATTFNLTYTHP